MRLMDTDKLKKVLRAMWCCQSPWDHCHKYAGGCPYYKNLRDYSCRYELIKDTHVVIEELLSEMQKDKGDKERLKEISKQEARLQLRTMCVMSPESNWVRIVSCLECKERSEDKYINSDGVEVSACDICVNNEQAVKWDE